jgi:hypothetical protein
MSHHHLSANFKSGSSSKRLNGKFDGSSQRYASIVAGLVASGLAHPAEAAADTTLQPAGGKNLREFSDRLAELPRRRDYKTVPMIADKPDLWDKAALDFVVNYKGGPRQAWDHTDLNGGWLNGMPKHNERPDLRLQPAGVRSKN